MWRIVCVSLGLFLLLGCTSKRPKTVSGSLRYKDQPVGNVVLRLYPASGADIPVAVNQEGKFSTTGLPPGEYTVVVEGGPPAGRKNDMLDRSTKGMDPAKVEEMKQKMAQMPGQQAPPTVDYPAKYKKTSSSDLKCTISEGANQNLELVLTD